MVQMPPGGASSPGRFTLSPPRLRNPPCLKQQGAEGLDGAVRQHKLLQRVQALPDGQLQLGEVLGKLQLALGPERAHLRGGGGGER